MPINIFETGTNKPLTFDNPEIAEQSISQGIGDFDPKQEVYIKDIDKGVMKISGAEASNLIRTGAPGVVLASDQDIQEKFRQEQYKGPLQQTIAAAESVGKGATLGFGPALTRVGIELLTPKGSTLGEKYQEGSKERAGVYPKTALAGEIAGVATDPLGIYGLVTKGAKAATGLITRGAEVVAESRLTPKAIEKVLSYGAKNKAIAKGIEFGVEGGVANAAFETGRQLQDDAPLNGEAIADSFGKGVLYTAPLGVGLSLAEQAGATAIKKIKEQAKKYVDKVTGVGSEAKGEIFKEVPIATFKKEKVPTHGRSQDAIKLIQDENGVFKYADDRKEGIVKLIDDKNGLDLTSNEQMNSLGNKVGIDDLAFKNKVFRKPEESLTDFMINAKKDQYYVENLKELSKTYMSVTDFETYEKINKLKEAFGYMKAPNADDIELYKKAVTYEKQMYDKYKPYNRFNPKYADQEKNILMEKRDADLVKRSVSEYDFISDAGKNGTKTVHVYNENILPKTVTVKNLGKGIVKPSFEAGQTAKQYKMTPGQMGNLGAKRLNEVSDFIIRHYPEHGSILKKATTSADYILEGINTTKNIAINEIDDAVEYALNARSARQRVTNLDIAKWVERDILPEFTDSMTGNAKAGFQREFDEIKKFAEGYRQNGFTENQYGQRTYKPLDIREIRELRIDLDKKAKWDKDTSTNMQAAARNLRGTLEDEVISRISKADSAILEKYKKAKKDYGLAMDAEAIVEAAVNKSAKEHKFSMFYSSMGAGVGAGVAGVPGAIIGGIIGGKANMMMKEYSGNMSIFMARGLAKDVDKYERSIQSAAKSFFKPTEKIIQTYVRIPKDNESDILNKDYSRLTKELSDKEHYMESFVDNNEFLFSKLPKTSEATLQTVIRAREFLMTKIPQNPYAGNPFKEKTWIPSPYEMDKYMRYREAMNRPSMIIDQIRSGYATPEAVEVLTEVYPQTKEKLRLEFINQASSQSNIPVEKRVEIYKIFGIQMDSFMSGKDFVDLQSDSNAQALETQNAGMNPNNAFKTNMDKKDLTLGNETVK